MKPVKSTRYSVYMWLGRLAVISKTMRANPEVYVVITNVNNKITKVSGITYLYWYQIL